MNRLYYIKYNDVDLTQMVKVREVSLPSLPEIQHDSIDLWEMDGNIFNSVSYGNRTINLRFLIQPLDPNELEVVTQDVKRAFYTREPKELYVGSETKYMLCVPEGEVVITELGVGTNEIEISLIAYYPYWISTEVMLERFEEKEFTITNKGDTSATPVISVNIPSDTHFIQLENQTTNQRILIGQKPTVEKAESIKPDTHILLDEFNTISGWVSSTAAIDPSCGVGGTMTSTADANSIMCGNFGNANTTWKGACYRKSLDIPLKNFKVKAYLRHASDGMNGDPSVKQYMADCVKKESGGSKVVQETVVSGEETLIYYSYHPQGGLINIYRNPSKNSLVIGQFSPDQKFNNGRIENGWLKIDLPWFGDPNGYVETGRFKAKVGSTTVTTVVDRTVTPTWTDTLCNYVANTTAKLRSNPNEDSSIKCTVPSGTVLRCSTTLVNSTKEDENNKYWKVYSGYNNQTGYIVEKELTRASEVEVVYEQTPITADDKTGRIQVYGFSNSGVQLFSMGLIDDSEWYESTYPIIKKNGLDFLKDVSFNVPKPKQTSSFSSNTLKYTNIMSGQYGGWNSFFGVLYIERINDVWYAWIEKTEGGHRMMASSKVKDTINGNLDLGYIVIYAGTSNPSNPCDMSFERLEVMNATEINFETQNVLYFEEGDVVEIDCGVPCVKVNGEEMPSLVDIGSQFFDLQKGVNVIKVASDSDVITSVAYNERYL